MGQQLQRRSAGTPDRRPETSWLAAARNTARLWLERHYIISTRRGQRRRLLFVGCALVAMGFGAGVTLAFTGTSPKVNGDAGGGTSAASPLQQAVQNRQQAAAWVAQQVAGTVACDPEMCQDLMADHYPAGELNPIYPSTPDPEGAVVVVATPVIQSQFGTRLASVYAPQVIASFGTGAEQIQVRNIPPGGTAAFKSELAPDRTKRITAGQQLAGNARIQASAAAKAELLAGQVDWRLLATLPLLTSVSPLQLIKFDDSSPGVGNSVPLRGAWIGAPSDSDLTAIVRRLKAQINPNSVAEAEIEPIAGGKHVVVVSFSAPALMGPMGQGGS
jgi:hypothetical protein